MGTRTHEPLDARSVLSLDVHGGVDAEATGALPGEHAVGVDLVEQATAAEVAEDATLDGGLELEPVVGGELGLPLEVGPPPLPSAQVGWSILRWPESAETQPWRKEGPKMA